MFVTLSIDRCLWRRAWTKPSSTSAESWNTRPTTSTSPNPKPPAWRRDDRDTTESCHRLFSLPKRERGHYSRANEDEAKSAALKMQRQVKLSGTCLFFFFSFNSFVFLKKRLFFLSSSRQFFRKEIVLPCRGAAATVWFAPSHPLLIDEPKSEKVCPGEGDGWGRGRGVANLSLPLFFSSSFCEFVLFFFCYLIHRLDERFKSYSTSVRACLISVMVCPPQTSCLSHCTVCPLSGH